MLTMRHLALFLALSTSAEAVLADSLHVCVDKCVDKNPLPPFVYSEKINGAGNYGATLLI